MPDDVAAENKRLELYIFDELYEKHNLDIIDEMWHPEWIDRNSEQMRPGEDCSRDGLRAVLKQSFEAFPDGKITIDDVVAEGDRVVVRFTSTGTHTGGEFMGMPPTGKKSTTNVIVIDRFRDGKLIESWGVAEVPPALDAPES